jgi:sulfur carrier protein ThiS
MSVEMLQLQVKWLLISRPHLDKTYEIPKGTRFAKFLPRVLDRFQPDEVIIVYNGRPVSLTDRIEQSGTIELIPVLCGG